MDRRLAVSVAVLVILGGCPSNNAPSAVRLMSKPAPDDEEVEFRFGRCEEAASNEINIIDPEPGRVFQNHRVPLAFESRCSNAVLLVSVDGVPYDAGSASFDIGPVKDAGFAAFSPSGAIMSHAVTLPAGRHVIEIADGGRGAGYPRTKTARLEFSVIDLPRCRGTFHTDRGGVSFRCPPDALIWAEEYRARTEMPSIYVSMSNKPPIEVGADEVFPDGQYKVGVSAWAERDRRSLAELEDELCGELRRDQSTACGRERIGGRTWIWIEGPWRPGRSISMQTVRGRTHYVVGGGVGNGARQHELLRILEQVLRSTQLV